MTLHTKKKKTSARILLVEDDPDVREVVQTILESAGYNVTAVADGGEMRTTLASARFGIALVDLTLPAENGIDLIPILQERSIPVIAMSGNPSVLENRPELPCPFLPKSFQPDKLLRLVAAVIRGEPGGR